MASCGECRRPITSGDMKTAKVIKENGRVKEILHNKCTFVRAKHERMGPNGRYGKPPTAYEKSLAHHTADDVTAEARKRREAAEAELARLEARRQEIHEAGYVNRVEGTGESVADVLDELDREAESAQQALSLAQRQEEMAAERAKEDHRSEIVDWREPTVTDV